MYIISGSKDDTNKTNAKKTWTGRLKKYILSNADYFAAASTMMAGNAYGAAQIMQNSKF